MSVWKAAQVWRSGDGGVGLVAPMRVAAEEGKGVVLVSLAEKGSLTSGTTD